MVYLDVDDGPFTRFIGIKAVESSEGRGKAILPVRPELLQGAGVVQGGLVVTLADFALYLAVRSLLKEDESTLTVELKVNFIAPATGGELSAEASVVSRGNRIVVGEVEVKDDGGRLIARGLGTSMVRRQG